MKVYEMPVWLSFCLICAVSPKGMAQGVILDQQNNAPAMNGSGSILNGQMAAQTLQVGISGTLERIDFAIYIPSGTVVKPDAPFTAEIRNTTAGGLPGSLILASSIVPVSLMPLADGSRFTTIDFSTSQLSVEAGESLSIVLRTQSTGAYRLLASASYGVDGYPSGVGYINYGTGWQEPFEGVPRWDWGFRTYVTVPEPTAVSLFALCILGLGFQSRVRKSKARPVRLHSEP